MTREEAIRRIKAWNLDPDDREVLATIIPELRESEDEKIRKWIHKYIAVRLDDAGEFIGEYREALAWLEKQKEQKHPNGCFTCDEYKKGYEEGRRNGFTAGYNKAMKEVEQKPVVTHGETYRVDTLGTQQVIAGKMPQKPAEWSEEDEEIFNNIIEKAKGGHWIEVNEITWLITRFKSLRPQSYWKPSEEQMKALNAINCCGDLSYVGQQSQLISLYNDLKKL